MAAFRADLFLHRKVNPIDTKQFSLYQEYGRFEIGFARVIITPILPILSPNYIHVEPFDSYRIPHASCVKIGAYWRLCG